MFLSGVRRLQLTMLAALASACVFNSSQSPAQSSEVPTIQAAPQARIVPPSPLYQFPNGKKFIYVVEWRMFTAGAATMEFDPDGNGEKLTGTSHTSGAVNFIFPVHSWFEARIDSKTFCSTKVFKHSEEGKRKKEVQIYLDAARGKSIADEKNLKNGEARRQEDDAPSCATDILSGFFYLASRPLLPSSEESFPVVDGGKTTIVRARAEGREEVKVPAGDFQTIRVLLDPLSGKFEGKGQIWVWYSDDAAHTPIQMKARLSWGTVMFKLERIEK